MLVKVKYIAQKQVTDVGFELIFMKEGVDRKGGVLKGPEIKW